MALPDGRVTVGIVHRDLILLTPQCRQGIGRCAETDGIHSTHFACCWCTRCERRNFVGNELMTVMVRCNQLIKLCAVPIACLKLLQTSHSFWRGSLRLAKKRDAHKEAYRKA